MVFGNSLLVLNTLTQASDTNELSRTRYGPDAETETKTNYKNAALVEMHRHTYSIHCDNRHHAAAAANECTAHWQNVERNGRGNNNNNEKGMTTEEKKMCSRIRTHTFVHALCERTKKSHLRTHTCRRGRCMRHQRHQYETETTHDQFRSIRIILSFALPLFRTVRVF